ncbi:outer membrane beta-barrel protein [bacterium]|jgi:hypothetical protein|nr:outer membrane beta-barrel protein [bacterium]
MRKTGYLFLLFSVVFLLANIAIAETLSEDRTTRIEETLPVRSGILGSVTKFELTNNELPLREGLKADPFLLHAAFTAQEQWDSNIFLTEDDEKEDFITKLSPSIGIELPIQEHKLSADYKMDAYFFARYDREDYIDHTIRGLAALDFTNFRVNVSEMYRRFSDRSGSEDTNRIRQQHNHLRAGVSSAFDQLSYDIGYTFGIEDYLNDEIIAGPLTYDDKDRKLHVVDVTLSYRFAPKTSFLVESDLGFYRYNSRYSSDSWYTEDLVGLKGELTDKITINGRAGLRYQKYDSSDYVVDKDFFSFVCKGGIEFKASKDDVFTLNVERSIYESTYQDINYYNVNFVSLSYTHWFNDKVSANLYGDYQYNWYPEETTEGTETARRYDHIFGGGGGLRYDVREWLSLEAMYEYKQRDSKFDTFDFEDHIITVKGTVGF